MKTINLCTPLSLPISVQLKFVILDFKINFSEKYVYLRGLLNSKNLLYWIKSFKMSFIEMSYLAINKRTLKTLCLQNIKIKVLHLEHYY